RGLRDALDGAGERVAVLEAARGVDAEAALDDPSEGSRDRGAPRYALPQLAGEALVEDRAERVNVGRRADGARVVLLLGRHVLGRPEALVHRREGAGLGGSQRATGEALRDPEVGDERPSVVREEHVPGLQIPVHDPALVGAADRPGEAEGELDGLVL